VSHFKPCMARLAVHDAAADRRAQARQQRQPPPIQAVQLPTSGSHSQTRQYLHNRSRSS
jgi:hypothetical protein